MNIKELRRITGIVNKTCDPGSPHVSLRIVAEMDDDVEAITDYMNAATAICDVVEAVDELLNDSLVITSHDAAQTATCKQKMIALCNAIAAFKKL